MVMNCPLRRGGVCKTESALKKYYILMVPISLAYCRCDNELKCQGTYIQQQPDCCCCTDCPGDTVDDLAPPAGVEVAPILERRMDKQGNIGKEEVTCP